MSWLDRHFKDIKKAHRLLTYARNKFPRLARIARAQGWIKHHEMVEIEKWIEEIGGEE
jgi:hypothetical protein